MELITWRMILFLAISFMILIITPVSSVSKVSVFPSGPSKFILGGNATFRCVPRAPGKVAGIEWLVNGDVLNITSDDVRTTFSGTLEIGILEFHNISEDYNNTLIQCTALMVESKNILSSNIASIVLLPGFLSAVRFLRVDQPFFVTWLPPATPNTGPITYCAAVHVNSASTSPLYSKCGISETGFNYTLPPDSWCDVYFISVSPVSRDNVRGTTSTIRYSRTQIAPRETRVVCMPASSESNMTKWTLIMSARVCKASVIIRDLYTQEEIDAKLSISGFNITISEEQLTPYRNYYLVITASNPHGTGVSSEQFSTHDVVDFVVNRRNEPGFQIATVLSHCSHAGPGAIGALFNFVFIAGDVLDVTTQYVDLSKSFLVALDIHNHTLPFDLYPGYYRVYAYDIEHDGTFSSGMGYPGAIRGYIIRDFPPIQDPQLSQKTDQPSRCCTSSSHDTITVWCSFPHDTVVIGYQVIAQLKNVSEMFKLYINQSMDLRTPVTVLVERGGEYRVSIFYIIEGKGILNSMTSEEHFEQVLTVTRPEQHGGLSRSWAINWKSSFYTLQMMLSLQYLFTHH